MAGRAARGSEEPLRGGAVLSLLLLHTTFLIDTERGQDEPRGVISDDDDVAIAAITVAELLLGVALADGARRETRQAFVEGIIATIPILDYDLRIARAHADLLTATRRTGRPRGAHDLLIAATSVATGRTVVTADSGGFDGLPGVEVLRHR